MKSHPHRSSKKKVDNKFYPASAENAENDEVEKQLKNALEPTPNRLTIIWNAVLPCDFGCSICCLNAWHIRPCEYRTYERTLVGSGKQLSLQGMLLLIDQITEMKGRKGLDISGGNPAFLLRTAQPLFKAIRDQIGRENVSFSVPGSLIAPKDAEFIASFASAVEVTVDGWPGVIDPTRHPCMTRIAVNALKMFRKYNVRKVSSTVIKSGISTSKKYLAKLADFLKSTNAVDEWEWLRYLPVGRGANQVSYILKPDELPTIAASYESLSDEYSDRFEIKLQHSLLNMFRQFSGREDARCKAMKNETLGILPDGTVLSCPWLLDAYGRPISPEFKLGKAPSEALSDIVRRGKRIRKSDMLARGDCGECQLLNGCDECLAASQSASRLFGAIRESRDECTASCFPSAVANAVRPVQHGCYGKSCSRAHQCLSTYHPRQGRSSVSPDAFAIPYVRKATQIARVMR